jgi:pyocin large subunit-like protein
MTTTQTTTNGNGNANTNGNGSTAKATKAMTPVDAIGKISKILDQLSPVDRKRVLDFVAASGE